MNESQKHADKRSHHFCSPIVYCIPFTRVYSFLYYCIVLNLHEVKNRQSSGVGRLQRGTRELSGA